MKIRSCAPMRLGLAGGGTDIDAFAEKYGGYVLNVSICKYAITTLSDDASDQIVFRSDDMEQEETYECGQEISYTGKLDLLKAVYRYFISNYNHGVPVPLTVSTYCDAPAGSGLGASSTLMVSLVNAFAKYFGVGMGEYELAQVAFTIERKELGLAGGKQDQYAAAFGGFNFMEFYAENRVIVNPLRIKDSVSAEMEASILLFYSGISRESANIIVEQKQNVEKKSDESIQGLLELKKQALAMKEALLTGNFNGVVEALNKGWEAKKKTAKKVTSPRLDEIYQTAMKAGALAGKISGAGGGGFFMFIVPPEKRKRVINALEPFHGEFVNCVIDEHGSFAWKV